MGWAGIGLGLYIGILAAPDETRGIAVVGAADGVKTGVDCLGNSLRPVMGRLAKGSAGCGRLGSALTVAAGLRSDRLIGLVRLVVVRGAVGGLGRPTGLGDRGITVLGLGTVRSANNSLPRTVAPLSALRGPRFSSRTRGEAPGTPPVGRAVREPLDNSCAPRAFCRAGLGRAPAANCGR